MNKHYFKLLAFSMLILLVVSCGKNDKTGLRVPKDAAFVLHVNASSLSSKLSWKEIQASSWFQKIYSQNHDSLAKELMDDPENTGIDPKSDLVFFIKKRKVGGY